MYKKNSWLIMRTKKQQQYENHARFAWLQSKQASFRWPVATSDYSTPLSPFNWQANVPE